MAPAPLPKPPGLTTLPRLRDLSNWQGPVNWGIEKREIVGCYVKVTQGQTYTDPTAPARIRAATDARVPVGGYHYATPGVGSPESQAIRLLEHAPKRKGQLRPCLDAEANPLRLNDGQLAAWYLGFVSYIHLHTGQLPVIYGSPSYLRGWSLYHPEVFGACPLWIANYGVKVPTVPPPWSHWTAWQWTQTFEDPAVGRVDDSYVADLKALTIS